MGVPGQARQIRETTRSVKSLQIGSRSPTCLEAVSTPGLKERVPARLTEELCWYDARAQEHKRQYRWRNCSYNSTFVSYTAGPTVGRPA